MFKSSLKITLRSIRRHKIHSFVNIAGLAVGLAASILIFLWVRDERSVNRFHAHGKDIYRVIQHVAVSGRSMDVAATHGPLGPSLRAEIPEIVDAVRLVRTDLTLRSGGESYLESVGLADPSFFRMFSFPLIDGDPAAALSDPRSIVLSVDTARKYFPNENPLGKTILSEEHGDFRVTGIMKNFPRNSSLRYDILIPFVFGREIGLPVDQWDDSRFTTFVQLRSDARVGSVEEKIAGHLAGKPIVEKDVRLVLQPLSRMYLYPGLIGEPFPQGDIRYVRIFTLAALFSLLLACVNFMTLSTARSANRAREVGLRKVIGARRGQLVRQFYGECLILTVGSLILAIIGAILFLPAFNRLAAKDMRFDLFGDVGTVLGLIGLVLAAGALAGSYPALFLSNFRPAKVLRGTLSTGSRGRGFRRILVVFQFSVTILLLIGTLFVRSQLEYMRSFKTGYDAGQVLTLRMGEKTRAGYEAIKAELLRHPDILGVSAASNLPTRGFMYRNTLWDWSGKNPKEEVLIRGTCAEAGYFDLLGIDILQGRDFVPSDNPDDVQWILNEEAVRIMGLTNPVGQRLSQAEFTGTIVGVVKNYHFTVLREKLDPLAVGYSPDMSRILFVKIRPGKTTAALSHLETIWKIYAPGDEFRYHFLRDDVDALYRSEERVGAILRAFSLLAAFISGLGLFGLAAFLAEKKMKEIGIRKVLGASMGRVVMLLTGEFVLSVLAANLIAWPAAYYFEKTWLKGYAYRITIGPLPYLSAAVLAVLVVFVTVSFQVVRAARTNPAETLKYE